MSGPDDRNIRPETGRPVQGQGFGAVVASSRMHLLSGLSNVRPKATRSQAEGPTLDIEGHEGDNRGPQL